MNDPVAGEEFSPKEALELKHKSEKKELQAKIQTLKKGIPKGDKKKNKEVKGQIAVLENELSQRHEKESSELDSESESIVNGHDEQSAAEKIEISQPRISKAQRKRDKKALRAKEQAEIAVQAEKDYVNTLRYAEEEQIKNLLAAMSLQVKTVVSDGNCLYYAIEDQLKKSTDTPYTLAMLRQKTSDYMLSHVDEFIPFLTDPNTGDSYDSEKYQKYCHDVANTAAWGGQLELRALSHILQTPIQVIQADMPSLTIGEEYKGDPIIITYHRHELGLGEHYNSVKPFVKSDGESFS